MLSSVGLLQPLLVQDLPREDISMDFIGGLPKLEGKDTLLVVVECLTKYAHSILLKHLFIAQFVAEAFVREVV